MHSLRDVGLEIFTVMKIQVMVFLFMIPCSDDNLNHDLKQ